MPLQNRVAPDGSVHANPARGLFTGNRGIIHNPETMTLLRRRWTNKAWIICETSFRGRHREIMSPGSWTELFFVDEATALASGHRPCFECRHGRAVEFADRFAVGNSLGSVRAGLIDARLHGERLASGRSAPVMLTSAQWRDLPDGTMLECQGEFFAIRHGEPLRWTFAGYQRAAMRGARAKLVTPPSTVAALVAGYVPVWHPTCRGR